MDEQEDGQRYRARIVKVIQDHEGDLSTNTDRVKFLCSVNDKEEIITYNEILDHLQKDEEDKVVWKFKHISAHEGPLTPNHPSWNGSSYNVMMKWENGEKTSEPLDAIAADDPVTCAIYARDHNLLDTPGWRRF